MMKRLIVGFALLLPGLAGAQVSVGLGLGNALAVGDASKGSSMSSTVQDAIPIELDASYRVLPRLSLGAYVSYGPAFVGSVCAGASCSGSLTKLGLEAAWHFDPIWHLSPWAGAAIGYEWADYSGTQGADHLEVAMHGFDFLGLKAGADYQLMDRVSVGPFLAMTLGTYDMLSLRSPVGDSAGGAPQALHAWLQIGIHGSYDF